MARLPIRLMPGAARDGVDGWTEDAAGRPVLKVRVRARPVEGEANAALIRLLSRWLDLPASAIELARGGQSRTKMILIEGLDQAGLDRRIAALLATDDRQTS